MSFRLFPKGVPAGKRMLDLIIAIIALIILSPLILVLALIVRIKLGSPVLFRQKRPGYHNEIFTIRKFRTMKHAVDQNGKPLPDALRLTRLGKWMRATSLDELPELFNVLMGEMSIAGPRPLLIHYLPLYSAEQARRHDVLPGMTGWAQINGRNALTWDDKFKLDVWYVDHWTFWLDIKIMLMTVWKVLSREGISQPGEVTTQEFTGNQ